MSADLPPCHCEAASLTAVATCPRHGVSKDAYGAKAPNGRRAKRTTWGEIEQAYRDGRKDERIEQMLGTTGMVYCEWGALQDRLTDSEYVTVPPQEFCMVMADTYEQAQTKLDYAHFTKRSRAQGYRPTKGGQNDADFYLLCRSHHEQFDNWRPRFGEAS